MVAQPGFGPQYLAICVDLNPQGLRAIKRGAGLRQYLAPAFIGYVV